MKEESILRKELKSGEGKTEKTKKLLHDAQDWRREVSQGEGVSGKQKQSSSLLIHLCLFWGKRLGVLKMYEACSAKSCPVQSHNQT